MAPPHGRGVYCTFCGSWWMVSRHDLIVCKNWYKHNLKVGLRRLCTAMYLKMSVMNEFFNPKVGLRALFSGPHWLAPYLLCFLILEKQPLIFRTGVSCFSVTLFYFTLFCCGGKANLVQFTLFYSTLLTLTDRQNDRQRNEYTGFAWAGGTFFPVVLLCCVSFWFWREMWDIIFWRIVLGSSGK